jgi:hypothetical protein
VKYSTRLYIINISSTVNAFAANFFQAIDVKDVMELLILTMTYHIML